MSVQILDPHRPMRFDLQTGRFLRSTGILLAASLLVLGALLALAVFDDPLLGRQPPLPWDVLMVKLAPPAGIHALPTTYPV